MSAYLIRDYNGDGIDDFIFNTTHVTGEAVAAYSSYLGADKLDRNHEWVSQEQRPEKAKPELRAPLRICSDAARIIVGGTGD